MPDERSLNHSVWEYKYHIVWIPKCGRKQLYGQIAKYLGEIFHELARQKESQIAEGHLCPDHVHMLIAIPPKHAATQAGGLYQGKKRDSPKLHGVAEKFLRTKLLGEGYYVSTVGRDEEMIKWYIQECRRSVEMLPCVQ